MITPPSGSRRAKKLLMIGQDLSPQSVGDILYAASSRVGIGQPNFVPTIIDGGVDKFTSRKVAERVISGFLRAAETERAL